MRWDRWIDALVSPQLRERGGDELRQGRLISVMLVLAVIVCVSLGTVRLLRGLAAPAMIPFTGVFLALFLAARRFGKPLVITRVVGAIWMLGVVVTVVLHGSMRAPILGSIAILPLMMTLVGGIREGATWTALVALLLAGGSVYEGLGLPWPIDNPNPSRAQPVVAAGFFTLTVFALAAMYEQGRLIAIRALERSAAEKGAMLRALPDLLLQFDERGVCLTAHMGRVTAFVGETLIGRRLEEIFPEIAEQIRVQAGTDLSADQEIEVVRNGRTVGVRAIEDGPRLLLLGRDVTEARELQAQLKEAELRASLERADRMSSVGLLAAGMAHEINNPLAYLKANLVFLEDSLSPHLNDGTEEALTDVKTAIERIGRIVTDLKLYSRPDETPGLSVRLEDVVDSAVKMARNELRHRAQLSVRHLDAPPVAAVEARLVQVVLNLLVNSAQAIEPGAASVNRVDVRTFRDKDGAAVISVADTGPGIAAETLRKITEPFFTTKPIGVGTGLGLSVCESIVRAAGGELHFESKVGVGTTATIRLPAASVEKVKAASERPAAIPAATSGRILIVDDEPLVRRALRRLLRRYDLVEVSSGVEALELLRSDDRFDVVLCDVMMPEMTGIDVYRELSNANSELCSRLVLMTGGAFGRDMEALFSELSGRLPVIQKPFDPGRLDSLIAEQIAENR